MLLAIVAGHVCLLMVAACTLERRYRVMSTAAAAAIMMLTLSLCDPYNVAARARHVILAACCFVFLVCRCDPSTTCFVYLLCCVHAGLTHVFG
jgi:hypothetical protein